MSFFFVSVLLLNELLFFRADIGRVTMCASKREGLYFNMLKSAVECIVLSPPETSMMGELM